MFRKRPPSRAWLQDDKDGTYYRDVSVVLAEMNTCNRRRAQLNIWNFVGHAREDRVFDALEAEFLRLFPGQVDRRVTLPEGDRVRGGVRYVDGRYLFEPPRRPINDRIGDGTFTPRTDKDPS